MSELCEVCRPIIRHICEYNILVQSGISVESELMKQTIKTDFATIYDQCEENSVLKRDFSRIEHSLVFFVDYIIKEGRTPLASEWREMARQYNELSGDEKFFDLLADTLDDPDASTRLKLYYIFMGVGFDGCHKADIDFIERRMKLCSTRFSSTFNLSSDQLSEPNITESCLKKKEKAQFWSVYGVFFIAFIFAVIAFIYNYYVFTNLTDEYASALNQAEDAADPLHFHIKKVNLGDSEKIEDYNPQNNFNNGELN